MQERDLTWTELFSDRPALDYARIFDAWAPRITVDYEMAPIGFSAFGLLFFLKRDESVHCLDPLRGEIRPIAPDFAAFQASMNSEEWQIENLHSILVAEIVARGMTRGPTQSYALAPHPNLSGASPSLQTSNVMVMDTVVWHSVCAQSF